MWTQLNVWVVRGLDACLVEDSTDWTVYTTDAHSRPFSWKGIDYTQGLRLSQPGHLAVEIPPGAYILWAETETDKGTLRTHKAVVQVSFQARADVLLLPDIQPDRPEPDPHECAIAITSVVGVGSPNPSVVKVSGTASGCDQVEVNVSGSGVSGSKITQVPVDANGNWSAELADVPGVACGRPVITRAACVADPDCHDLKEIERLECSGPG